MKLKIDADGHVVVVDGKPVYVHDDGKEVPFDALHTISTITRLNNENKTRREEKEAVEAQLKGYEGIEDPEEARTAIATMKNLSAGELKTAAQVAEMQKAAQKAAEEQVKAASETGNRKITELTKERDRYANDLYQEKVGGAFSRSAFVKDKIVVPVDMLQSMFQNRFKTEDGKIVGHDAAGNKIYSRVKNGELADFDEALETIVDGYPNRDAILKGSGATGSGAQPTRHSGGGNTVSRGDFERLSPTQKAEMVKTHKIVD